MGENDRARQKNREATLRLTYKLLRRMESQEGRSGVARCPECKAWDEGEEHLPKIQHHPGCLMAAALRRWENHFSEAERGLRLAVAALGNEGEEVLVEEEREDTFRLTIPEGHIASWSWEKDPVVVNESTGKVNWPATHEYRKLVLEPSQPPGDTIPPNPGVGMGEGEKVAQDGSEEARGVEEAVGRIVNEAIQRAVGRLACPPGYLEMSKELLRRAQEALEEDDSPEAEYYGNCRDANATFPSPRPPCDCPHEMGSDCATCNPRPVMPRRYICEKHDETYCCPFCESEFFEHIGLDPCPLHPHPL